jgi:hypothetical protein
MGAHALEIVALGDKVRVASGVVYEVSDVTRYNMEAGADKAQRGSKGAALVAYAAHAASQCFNGTEPAWASGVMNSCAPLPVLLVVHPQSHGVGMQQIGEWGCVWYHESISLSESDILESKLHGPGLGCALWHSIFSHSEEKEKGNCR